MRTSIAASMLALALGGCRPDSSGGIAGEWTVRLDVSQAGTAGGPRPGERVQGILVIDPRIPDGYGRRADRAGWAGFTMGRAYLVGPLAGDSAPRPYRFKPGLPEDLFEEALARIDSAGGFQAEVAPGVTHVGISLRGTMSNGGIAGRWTGDGYVGEVGARGTFTMRRTRRSAATDSALRRARRGEREWGRESR